MNISLYMASIVVACIGCQILNIEVMIADRFNSCRVIYCRVIVAKIRIFLFATGASKGQENNIYKFSETISLN